MNASQIRPTPPLRWGLLGTARINKALIPPLRMSKRNQLTAVASRSLEKASAYAREWRIPRFFGSYEEMLADPEIDVIYNSLPNSLHAEWTVRSAEAGKHVLCEKPLALSVDEVDRMEAAAARAGVVVAEAFMYRHHPQSIKVKELVDSGVIGEVWLVRGSFTFNISNEDDVRLDPELGGGSVWDVGCYPISYARFLLEREPEEVYGWQRTGAKGADESFVGQLRFPGNIYAQFDSGFRTANRAEIEVVGSQGTIKVPNPYKPGRNEKVLLSKSGHVQVIRPPGMELYLGEVEDLADAILLGRPPRISLSDSRNNVSAILALLRSAQRSSPVKL